MATAKKMNYYELLYRQNDDKQSLVFPRAIGELIEKEAGKKKITVSQWWRLAAVEKLDHDLNDNKK